jgi:hypothetical protein
MLPAMRLQSYLLVVHTKIKLSQSRCLIDYGRAAWLKLQRKKFKSETARFEALEHFDAVWTSNKFLCQRTDSTVKWTRFSFDPG